MSPSEEVAWLESATLATDETASEELASTIEEKAALENPLLAADEETIGAEDERGASDDAKDDSGCDEVGGEDEAGTDDDVSADDNWLGGDELLVDVSSDAADDVTVHSAMGLLRMSVIECGSPHPYPTSPVVLDVIFDR